ncbi:tetratricopeptide repeat protein [Streptomyces sp. ALB3]|uniref:tetratricopeptide repeat protein n=1 Tax=Streptomyces sp. ALB3 TaxID=3374278 RepID=UPI0037B95A11
MGRRGELAVFRETFARDPEEVDFPFLFHVRGNGGVGKTTLVRQWESAAREQPSVVTAYVDDEVHDAVEAMEAVSARLGRQGHPLKRFDKQLATYRQRRHQAESAAPAPQPDIANGQAGAPVPAASPSSTVAAQVGLVGLGMVPGVGAFAGAVDPQQVALGADRVRAALNMRLRSHDDVQLVMNPVAVLAPVFLEDLADLAERCERVVLFFDVYERTGPVLDAWLHAIVFGEEYGGLPVNVQVVLSGQPRLDPRVWGDRLGQVTEVCLEVFTEEEARTLLAGHGVTDEPSIELVLRLSGRLPLLVDMLARSGASSGDSFGDPSETAVERFLKWEPDAERREAALACALPLQIDEDIYRAVVPEAAGSYAWLRTLAFVSVQAGRCRYHDVVRAAMLRLQRTRSPARWKLAHTRLADLFQQWRLAVEAEVGTDTEDHWRDSAWREHRLNETYHRLCAHPRTALPDALGQGPFAVEADVATLRRWAQIIGRAGVDTDSAVLAAWGHRLEAASEQERPGAAVLTVLLGASELDAPGRASAYAIRAAECRGAGDAEGALADCAAAVALAPDSARPHAGLGETYRVLGRYEEAVASCTRAVEIEPRYVLAYGSRGDAYRNLGRHDEALADFGRAVEIDPQYAWAYASRARVYEALGLQEEALADYDRAIGIDPLYEWAVGSRAQLFERMGRHDEALADFGRAVEIDPQYAWAYAGRAKVYGALGRQDEALADYDRAIGIDPLYEWAVGSRAQLFERMGRYEEALADFGRAVEIDPQYAWAYGNRAQVYEALGRREEALADYTRAIGIVPEYLGALVGRAQVHAELGRHEEALADFGRAVEAAPDSSWARTGRGKAYEAMGRHEEALADYTRAMEMAPDYAWPVSARGALHLRLGRYEEALADLSRAVGSDPSSDWPLYLRARTYLCLGRHEDALADCARTVEIDAEDGWNQMLYALALRSAGDTQGARARFARATRCFTAADAGDSEKAVGARQGLLVLACAELDGEAAAIRCEAFVGAEEDLVTDTIEDLRFVSEVAPGTAPVIASVVRRLRDTP